MAIYKRRTSSEPRLIVNSNMESRLYRILPCFGLINLIISSGAQIYGAYSKGDVPIASFLTFLCFTTFLLYYCFELNQQIAPWENSPTKHKLQIGIWILMSAVMFGLGFNFSKFTSASASLSFFMVVIGANLVILHLYLIWEGDKGTIICFTAKRRTKKVRVNEKAREMKENQLGLVLENV